MFASTRLKVLRFSSNSASLRGAGVMKAPGEPQESPRCPRVVWGKKDVPELFGATGLRCNRFLGGACGAWRFPEDLSATATDRYWVFGISFFSTTFPAAAYGAHIIRVSALATWREVDTQTGDILYLRLSKYGKEGKATPLPTVTIVITSAITIITTITTTLFPFSLPPPRHRDP